MNALMTETILANERSEAGLRFPVEATWTNADADLARIAEELRELQSALGESGVGTEEVAYAVRARNEVLTLRRLVRQRLAKTGG